MNGGGSAGGEAPRSLDVRVHAGVSEIARDDWDALCRDVPFSDWTFLAACEEDSTVDVEGFLARPVTLWRGERLVAAVPLFVKLDGRAEFLYDFAWHAAAVRAGIPYYPKAVAMAPLTPVGSSRVLIAPGEDARALKRAAIDAVSEIARDGGLCGLHWLFTTEDETDLLEAADFEPRLASQLALTNPGWRDIADYLDAFRAKHRIKLRREMRRLDEQELEIETVTGEGIRPEHERAMRRFYEMTCLRHGTGSDYVKPGTWRRLFTEWRHRLVLCFAVRAGRGGGEPERVAGSLCVVGDDGELWGRYWGCDEELPSLYFNVAFFAPLRFLLERGGPRFWAGFGNSAYKHARGFEPVPVHSAHRVHHPGFQQALAEHLARERPAVERALDEAPQHSRLKGSVPLFPQGKGD